MYSAYPDVICLRIPVVFIFGARFFYFCFIFNFKFNYIINFISIFLQYLFMNVMFILTFDTVFADPQEFPNGDHDKLRSLAAQIELSMGSYRAPGTIQHMQTPVAKFWTFVHTTLGSTFDRVLTRVNPNQWSPTEHRSRLAIMMAFASEVTSTHVTVQSTIKYVQQTEAHFKDAGFFVWSKEHSYAEWKQFFRGLEVRKAFVKVVRAGFSASDVHALNTFTWLKVLPHGDGSAPLNNQSRSLDVAQAANLVALRSFSFITLFRVGEATKSGPDLSPLDVNDEDLGNVLPPLRLTRSMIRFVSVDGILHSVQIFPPRMKNMVNNDLARQMIEIRVKPGSFPDAAADLFRLFILDPVDPSLWSSTPLFRNTASNKPLAPRFLIQADRHAIRFLPAQFAGRDPLRFSGHSYRIGGVEALIAAGCPDMVIMVLGRWISSCWRLYARLGEATINKWRYRMCHPDGWKTGSPQDEVGEDRREAVAAFNAFAAF